MSYKSEIKDFLLNRGIDLVGISSVDRLRSEPKGFRPEDILPGAKSVIVFGRKILDGTMQALIEGIEENNEKKKDLYGAYGYELTPNFILSFDAFYLSQYIERKYGYISVPLPGEPLQNKTAVNIGRAAVAAGLGELAWNGRVVTKEFGPRIVFSVIITMMELEPDELYSGEHLCDPSKCSICVDVCPVQAISSFTTGDEQQCEIAGKEYVCAAINNKRCMVASYGLRNEFGGDKDRVPSIDPNDDEIESAFRSLNSNDSFHITHFSCWKCEKCLAYCPVGNWDEHFKSTEQGNCEVH